MTDREKLVYLIKENAKAIVSSTENGVCVCLDVETLADHLIAHGVTVKEPQKPLTVEEALCLKVVYIEMKDGNFFDLPVHLFRAWNEWEDQEIIHFENFGENYCNIDCEEKDYGKTWRCWAEKPTEAERKNAKWEE